MRLREHQAIQDGKLDMFRADPRLLTTEPFYNVRDLTTPDAVAKLDEMADSIAEVGVLDPLVVRFDGERIIVVEGHRRLAATMMAIERGAEIKSVPIYQEARSVNDAQRDLGLIISNSGEPLTPLEKAKVVGRLVAHGWSQQEIAKRCGWKSVGSVNQYLDMLALPEKVKDHVRQGTISATTARNLAKSDLTPEQQDELIRKNKEENKRLSGGKRRSTSTKVTKRTLKRDAKPKPETASANAARRESKPDAETPAHIPNPTVLSLPAPLPAMAPEVAQQLQVSSTNGSGDDRGDVLGDQGGVVGDALTELHAAQEREEQQIRRDVDTRHEILTTLINLTREADRNVQHNKSDDHPGYWSRELVDAIECAVAIIEREYAKPFEREAIPDGMSQDFAVAGDVS